METFAVGSASHPRLHLICGSALCGLRADKGGDFDGDGTDFEGEKAKSRYFGANVSPEGVHVSSNADSEAARASGGARLGRPMHSRIFRVLTGGWIAAKIFRGPLQSGHFKTSNSNTLAINEAQE